MMVEDYTKVEMGERGEESNAEDINVTPGKESSPVPQDIRDPHGINRHLKIAWELVITSRRGTRGGREGVRWRDCGMEFQRVGAERLKAVRTRILNCLLTAGIIDLLYCLLSRCVIPCVRISLMCLPPFQTMCRSSLDTVLGPLCSSAGRCLGKFQLRLART
uniref:Caveolin n=1 Tax=Callorhinchus milii TaxID=7868 RepID=A0A4W3GZU9_CALMI